MMADIRRGLIKRVVVYKLDYISRSILDFATMMETFQELHIFSVVSAPTLVSSITTMWSYPILCTFAHA